MCGIIGEINLNSIPTSSWLLSALKLLDHRGPDVSSTWLDSDTCVHLGHSRLSILDLSSDANQPFQLPDSPYICVYNGEIYNFKDVRNELKSLGYTFFTTSDTEVLLRAFAHYGPTILNKLNGMFSVCIYNLNSKTIYLARDRAGQKPLFYTHNTSSLVFSSEIKCLLSHPSCSKSICPTSLSKYFIDGYINAPATLYNDVFSLPPGHLLTYDLSANKCVVESYVQTTSGQPLISHDLSDLSTILTASVDRHLCSDVPIGILLSGGIDSSLLAAFAVKHNPDIKCFTVSFPGSLAFDESDAAHHVAKHLNLNHTVINGDDPSPDDFFTIASQFDQPLSDASVIPSHLLFREVSKHCTVALGGDGGDELLVAISATLTYLKYIPTYNIVPILFCPLSHRYY